MLGSQPHMVSWLVQGPAGPADLVSKVSVVVLGPAGQSGRSLTLPGQECWTH
jgi:hypothetical protein